MIECPYCLTADEVTEGVQADYRCLNCGEQFDQPGGSPGLSLDGDEEFENELLFSS